jgi:hypothetical protein
MATTSVGSPVATKTIAPPSLADDIWEFLEFTLAPLASLKLTVGLMAIAVLLIFIGTLAQTEADIWDVMRDYFRAWIAWVPLRVFTPKSFFPTLQPLSKSIGFYFPGGALVGSLLLLNLLAAHLVRFKTAAKGKELLVGWTVIGLGALLSALVILSVTAPGVQDKPWLSWSVVWYGVLLGLAFGCAASWVGAAQLLWSPQQSSLRLLLAVTLSATALALSILLVYCIVRPGEARLSEPKTSRACSQPS